MCDQSVFFTQLTRDMQLSNTHKMHCWASTATMVTWPRHNVKLNVHTHTRAHTHARAQTHTHTHTHTQMHCWASTATMVTWPRHKVKLNVHCLSCFLLGTVHLFIYTHASARFAVNGLWLYLSWILLLKHALKMALRNMRAQINLNNQSAGARRPG